MKTALALLLVALAPLAAALVVDDTRDYERGFPLIEVHQQDDPVMGLQIFSLTQDRSGLLYFGGLAGVASYDGAWWRRVALPNDSAVLATASGKGPEVAAGGIDELGWVNANADGALVYHSLIPQLPAEFRSTGDVRSICATTDGFVFVAERALIAWNGGAPRVIADWRQSPPRGRRCFRAGAATYIASQDGLARITNAGLVRAGFDGKTVDLVLPLDNGRLLVAVRDESLFSVDGTNVTPFSPDLSSWLQKKMVVAGCALPDGRLVIGTRQHGIAILRPDGTLEQRLDAAAGLPTDVLTTAITDREGSLWLAYHGPFVRVDLATPMSIIDARRGMEGATNSVARHRDRLYVSTSHGLFVSDRGFAAENPTRAFRLVEGLPVPAWYAHGVDDALLIGTGEGAFVLDSDGTPRRIDSTAGLVVYGLLRSQHDPTRIWMATKDGVGMLRYDTTQRGMARWQFEGLIAGMPTHTRRMVEDDQGALWVGTIFKGVIRVELTSAGPRLETFGDGEMDVAKVAGRIVLVREGEILEPVRGDQPSTRPDRLLGHIRGQFFSIAEDSQGNVWANGAPPLLVRRAADGSYAREALPLVTIDASRVQVLEADENVVWAATRRRLYRYETAGSPPRAAQPAPRIHRVVTGDNQPVTAALPYSFGRLRIEFAPASYQPGTLYRYRLAPSDALWSAWTSEPSIDYTNLDHGDYTFHVRARGASGQISDETRWAFSVRPPWYRTTSALIAWGILSALLIAAIVWLRTKALQRQAGRLRALIDERTEELREANAHLERLALLDELTGIANRRYFQRALGEDWRSAHEQRQPLALLLLDLDHFKRINDELGHPAGDATLVHVGRYLAREVRRSGDLATRSNDLVARIGGEEFAVLLTETTEEQAARIAEKLRAGVEQLSLGLTTSCGVAAMIPIANDAWNELLSAADRALYAAKNAGRNCVRTASESPAPASAAASS
jgi:diguanylate cyclase (GGDEF)-like protein